MTDRDILHPLTVNDLTEEEVAAWTAAARLLTELLDNE